MYNYAEIVSTPPQRKVQRYSLTSLTSFRYFLKWHLFCPSLSTLFNKKSSLKHFLCLFPPPHSTYQHVIVYILLISFAYFLSQLTRM